MFDGGLTTSELIAIDCIIEDLPIEFREKFIQDYIKEDPEEWDEYLNHRYEMGYPKL